MDQLMPRVSADGSRWVMHAADMILPGELPLQVDSANGANSQVTATLGAKTGLMTYITAFRVTALGATAGSTKQVAISGLAGGTQNLDLVVVAGAALPNNLFHAFDPPVPASALNTAIVGTLPALGTGNTTAAISVYGFRGNANNA